MGKYILYGAGEFGIKALNYFGKSQVKCFVDRSVSGFIEGVQVISPNSLMDYQKKMAVKL